MTYCLYLSLRLPTFAKIDPWPSLLQLNIEGLTANKISVIGQLAYKNKTLITVLQETHCTTADKLVIPNFSLAESVLSRNHGLVTLVHGRLEWSLIHQSLEHSETEWLCVDVAGYTIINVYKPSRSQFTPTAIPTFPHPSMYVGYLTANMSTGTTAKHLLRARDWTPDQQPTTLGCCMTQRKQSVYPLTDGPSASPRVWPSRVSARKTGCRTDVF